MRARPRGSRPALQTWRSEGGPLSLRLQPVHTIELTDDELRLVWAALHSYLDDFGHEEADVLRAIKEVLAKLTSLE
jgi:hypothetical protein